tara:strand:+ start:162 stop:395 length:234 start_codon:yes stop_codon:yes gene_type:complete
MVLLEDEPPVEEVRARLRDASGCNVVESGASASLGGSGQASQKQKSVKISTQNFLACGVPRRARAPSVELGRAGLQL